MHPLCTAVFEPGFCASPQVHIAAVLGGVVAIVSAVTGVFTVMRGQSFGGHALRDVSAAGGSAALLIGLSPVAGFVGLGIARAAGMGMIGVRRLRGRDPAPGIGLGTPTRPTVAILGVVALGSIATVGRPLLLSTVSPDIAAARGVPVRLVGLIYMLALAVSVGLSSLAVGAVLSTALLIGPAAAALRLTRRVASAIGIACLIGVIATGLGVLLAYDSYYWGSSHLGLPVSFFIVAVIFAPSPAAALPAAWPRARTREAAAPPLTATENGQIAA